MATQTPSNSPGAPPITPDLIFQLATGFMSAKHLFAANEVGLFEKLTKAWPRLMSSHAAWVSRAARRVLWSMR